MKKVIFTLFTVCSALAASAQNNVIQGKIYWDTLANNATNASFLVYLIVHDTAANTLTAVDSVQASGYNAPYTFSNPPAGIYRTKAAPVAGTVGYTYLLPSYHDSSFYWNSAQVINHNGMAPSLGKNIWMMQGTPAPGPGFIGGNISAGANKGTGAGIPGIMVALLDASNQVVKFTYTDANGDYKFPALAVGTYNVFPEATGYVTNPATGIVLTASQDSVGTLNFKQTPTHIKLIPAGIKDIPTANLFKVYPNPSDGDLQIRFAANTGKATISISDVTGRQVFVRKSNGLGTGQINVANLPAGSYFIKVATDKATHTEKIVIKH